MDFLNAQSDYRVVQLAYLQLVGLHGLGEPAQPGRRPGDDPMICQPRARSNNPSTPASPGCNGAGGGGNNSTATRSGG
jgi:hypothetical protein